jgi:tripartite-type tricarboxylate transporter receptor subunit TctC
MSYLRSFFVFMLGLVVGAGTAMAQDYPNRPIRFVAPYNPGGSYDTVARLLGQKLSDALGQPVVIENRPGAGSLIGTEAVAKSPADGYTIVIFGNSHAILHSVHKKASFNIQKDFAPVALIGTVPALLLVNPKLPADTVKDLIALAKAKPGELNFGSGGNGSSTHLGMEMFRAATGINLVHIPYKAGVPATLALIAGQTQVGLLDVISARAHVQASKLKPLATTTAERSAFFPDVMSMTEAGVDNYRYVEWFGIAMHADTPKDIIAKLNTAINRIVEDAEFSNRLKAMGATPIVSTPQQFGEFFDSEIKKNAEAVRLSGLKID